jgi:hypothetical protein
MAGERMRVPGYVELSAICTLPEARGRGLAISLVRRLMHEAFKRGETPFLHVVPTNIAAVSLYEKLGFSLRKELHVLRRRPNRKCGELSSGGPRNPSDKQAVSRGRREDLRRKLERTDLRGHERCRQSPERQRWRGLRDGRNRPQRLRPPAGSARRRCYYPDCDPVVYAIFDLLVDQGENIMGLPLVQRKARPGRLFKHDPAPQQHGGHLPELRLLRPRGARSYNVQVTAAASEWKNTGLPCAGAKSVAAQSCVCPHAISPRNLAPLSLSTVDLQ